MMKRPVIPVFVCPTCGRSSAHPVDIEQQYCVVCGFVETDPVLSTVDRFLRDAQQEPKQ